MMSDFTTSLDRLIETDEDETVLKDIGGGYPRFTFEPFGLAYNHEIILVKVGDEFIGSLARKTTGKPVQEEWYIAYLPKRRIHTHIRVASAEEGAQKLWQEHTGLVELPEIHRPHEPLPPLPDEPEHYENLHRTAHNLVNLLSENEDEEELFKDLKYDQLDMAVRALKVAGFEVTRAEREDDELILQFSWPAISAVSYINGWKRAMEALEPYMTITHHNYRIEKTRQTATALIRKRIEDQPGLWEVFPFSGNKNVHPAWYDIFFSGHKVGEVYLPSFNLPKDVAETFREELIELHKIFPFYRHGWQAPGNAFGSGPAVEWWRKNRSKLASAVKNRFNYDPGLLKQ